MNPPDLILVLCSANRYLERLAAGVQLPQQQHSQPPPAGFSSVQTQQTPAGFGVVLGSNLAVPQQQQPQQQQQPLAGFTALPSQQPSAVLQPEAQQPMVPESTPAGDATDVFSNWTAAGAPAPAPVDAGGSDLLGAGGGGNDLLGAGGGGNDLLGAGGGGNDLLGAGGGATPNLLGATPDLSSWGVPAGGKPLGSAESSGAKSTSSREINLNQLSAEDFTMDEPARNGAMPGAAGANAQQQAIMKFIGCLGVDPMVRSSPTTNALTTATEQRAHYLLRVGAPLVWATVAGRGACFLHDTWCPYALAAVQTEHGRIIDGRAPPHRGRV